MAESRSDVQRYRDAERALWQHYDVEARERFVEIDSGARLRVTEAGAGDPVLLIGGSAGTGPYFGPLVRELQARFRCLVVDRPGWGLSDPVDYRGQRHRDVAADLLIGTLDALGIDRAHVIGASIGDVWALAMAQREPSRVGRAVLLGGGPLLREVIPPPPVRVMNSPLGALMVRLPPNPRMMRKILRSRVGHEASVDAGRMDRYIEWRVAFERHTRSMHHERALVRAVLDGKLFRPGLTFSHDELATIEPGVLMVFGTNDPTGANDPAESVKLWRAFVDRLPGGELHLVDDAGHMPWFDDPEGVGARVGGFLAASKL